MADVTLTQLRITAGIWEGVLVVPEDVDQMPEIEVTHLEHKVHETQLTRDDEQEGHWLLRVAIPPDLIADGLQTFVISDRNTGRKLSSFAILAGAPLAEDLRAEIDLLRAELDLLKRAFRRHCVETGAN
ncbi:hypothetical protein AQS8620_00332 [Aquimixticola soesokkakensis]|uniref:Uncharacterized protein n=1 Tax=Aquimixticola soesokkakensis TaxID=1519096 RepID=A0A1Y5RGI8_9RHOB|nr:hypothetical protein [Aquimixticola soesokkakensis]SLN16727.1 hypothetical protein AQS8620_00332 [Aquimixticola soesokkakensis]